MNRPYGYNRTSNYRNGDNRKYYQNRDQSQSQRPVWQERRANFDQRNGGRPDRSGQYHTNQNNQNSQLPGIIVQKNAMTKAFEPNMASNNGSGDKTNGNAESHVDAMAHKLADIDINANESKPEANAVNTTADQSLALPQTTADGSTGCQSELKNETKVVNSTVSSQVPTPLYARRNTIGEVAFSARKPFIKNYSYGHKAYQSQGFNGTSKFKFDPNYRSNFRSKPKAYPQPSHSADLVPHMTPINPCVYNLQESCPQMPHYYIPNSLYQSVGYALQPSMPTSGIDFVEPGITQKMDNETNNKQMDAMNPTEPIPMVPFFVPFVPSPALPEPPHYYGHIVTCKMDTGVYPFFICDLPSNIAPLQLEVNSAGHPILPCNCHLWQLNYPVNIQV